MTYGRIIENTKYICLYNDKSFKKFSLEDNVYFTLRDIFLNADSLDTCLEANSFNQKLTNGIYFEERTDDFTYTNVLNSPEYLSRLVRWLEAINEYYFDFILINDDY